MDILEYPLLHHWADVFGIIGFPLALWGLWISIDEARKAKDEASKAKSAAEIAKNEVDKLRQTLVRLETIENLADAIAIMEEIKRLHRYGVWDKLLLDRYSTLRRKLVAIKTTNVNIKAEYATILQGAILQFRKIESEVEGSLNDATSKPTTTKLNAIVSTQIDKMDEVLNTMKQDMGEQ